MRGFLIIVLVGVTFKLFADGWLLLTVLPAIGIWYCVKTARTDPADEIFAGGFYLLAILVVVATGKWLLESLFGGF